MMSTAKNGSVWAIACVSLNEEMMGDLMQVLQFKNCQSCESDEVMS